MTAKGTREGCGDRWFPPTEKDSEGRGMPKGVFFREGGMLSKSAGG